MNSSSRSCQPVRLSGAKLGTFAVSAPDTSPGAATMQTTPANASASTFGTQLNARFNMSDLRDIAVHPAMIIADHRKPLDRMDVPNPRRSRDNRHNYRSVITVSEACAGRYLRPEKIRTLLPSLIGWGGARIGARGGVRIAHQGSVRQRHRHELPAIVAVAERMNDRLDL